MKIAIFILLNFILSNIYATPFEGREEKLFSLVKARLVGITNSEKFHPKREYYHYSFKTDFPRYRDSNYTENSQWRNDEIMFFSLKEGRVSQVALSSHRCGVDTSIENLRVVRNDAKELFKREVKAIFNTEFELTDNDIKSLGPEQSKIRRVVLNKVIPGTTKVRLSRGFYKCDGKSGHGYRLDFWLK